jgi:hypothetical protein
MQAPPPTDQAEAPIPPEIVSNDLIPPETGSNDENMNRTVKVRRKAANRTVQDRGSYPGITHRRRKTKISQQ